MDYNALMKLMAEKRQSLGERTADIPNIESTMRADLYGNDNVLKSLQSNETDKIKELYDHDKVLADRYANPQSEGYLEDPYAREKARANRFQGTAGELSAIQGQTQSRRDVLGSALEKAMKLLNYGLEAQKLEYSGLQDDFDNKMKLEDLQMRKDEKKKGSAADQKEAAYSAMVADLKGRMTLPEALVKHGRSFTPDEIYAAYNQVNNDPSRKKNYGPAKEAPESLQRIGITPPKTSSNDTQWEAKQTVAKNAAAAKAAGKSIEVIQKYIQSQGFNPTDPDFMGVLY